MGALVITKTGSATWAVVIAAAGFLPVGVLAPVGGALADRLPRRASLVVGNFVSAGVAALISVLVASHHDSPGLLAGLVALQGCIGAMMGPFMQAILPDLVPRAEFLQAALLGSAQFNLGRVVGPALAGAVIASFGYPVTFLANAISFMAVVAALTAVRLSKPPQRDVAERLLASMKAGLRALLANKGCRAAVGTIACVALVASPFIALVPAMARHLSHSGPKGIAETTGILTTAQGVGAVAGALVNAPLAARIGRGRALALSLLLLPLTLAAYGLSRSVAWATVALFLVGLVYIGVLSGLQTTVQLHAPTAYRGRILSFYLVALGVGYPIGALVQGPIADSAGLAATTVGSAILLLALIGAARVLLPGVGRTLTADVDPLAAPAPATAADAVSGAG